MNFHRRITERSFRSQGNNNGAESLAKIIDKPSKADHTASYIRHTPLRKIVTISDYTNRKKQKKNKSTYHWVYREWRATIPRREPIIVEKRSSWPCRPGYHREIVEMVQPDLLNLLVWGQDLMQFSGRSIDVLDGRARARARKIERSNNAGLPAASQRMSPEHVYHANFSRIAGKSYGASVIRGRMSHPDRHPTNRVLF